MAPMATILILLTLGLVNACTSVITVVVTSEMDTFPSGTVSWKLGTLAGANLLGPTEIDVSSSTTTSYTVTDFCPEDLVLDMESSSGFGTEGSISVQIDDVEYVNVDTSVLGSVNSHIIHVSNACLHTINVDFEAFTGLGATEYVSVALFDGKGSSVEAFQDLYPITFDMATFFDGAISIEATFQCAGAYTLVVVESPGSAGSYGMGFEAFVNSESQLTVSTTTSTTQFYTVCAGDPDFCNDNAIDITWIVLGVVSVLVLIGVIIGVCCFGCCRNGGWCRSKMTSGSSKNMIPSVTVTLPTFGSKMPSFMRSPPAYSPETELTPAEKKSLKMQNRLKSFV